MTVETISMSPLHQPLQEPLYGQKEGGKIADIPKFEESSIRKVCKLGSGCHSNVYLVATSCRQQLALKCLNTNTIPSQELHAGLTSDLMSEACILAGLDHENVIKIRGVSAPLDPMAPECEAIGYQHFFLMDVMSETLMDRVQRWKKDERNYKGVRVSSVLGKKFRKLDLKKMIGRMETTAIGIAKGMAYLHNKGMVVQDLKPANIGFDMQTGRVRIFDFGMARHVLDLSMNKTVEVCGTPRFMAPEVMQGETATKASDVYSFGCVLYTLCTLKVPFHDFVAKENELEEFKAKVVSGQRPCLKCIPSLQFRRLIADCWAQDPMDRPTFEEIVEERLPSMITLVAKEKRSIKRTGSGFTLKRSDTGPTLSESLHLPIRSESMNLSFRSDSGFSMSVRSWKS